MLFRALILTLALLWLPSPAFADKDAERARAALQAGQILPLGRILEAVQRDFNGEVIEVELDRERGNWVYEIKLLAPHGAVLKLDYDAANATLLRSRGHNADAARRRR
ncbi:PepSY domain-containing protein [Ferrovibrio sp.]|uniref:PepSY domain-containing protein n=1 Tax=Ferrovibrio sp. TaxID=1917215 RepID=UPI001B54CC63|nr:PepSY domain-containing protein [Ferrovibrio sp.]MBP7064196.1 PepSY domain-containing protein [Ferrovibrio sp.]